MVNSESLLKAASNLDRYERDVELAKLRNKNNELVVELQGQMVIDFECDLSVILELQDGDIKMPYPFEAGFIEEGEYKGLFLPAEELIAAKDTFFMEDDDVENNIVHWDHDNQYNKNIVQKVGSARSRIGKVLRTRVGNKNTGLIIAEGILTDEDAARSVHYGVNKRVSGRIVARRITFEMGRKTGRNLVFQELSIVSVDDYKKSYIKGV